MRTDRIHERIEQRPAVVRAWRGLWVVLDGEDGFGSMPESLDGTVVQVHVGYLELGRARNLFFSTGNRETMILRCD